MFKILFAALAALAVAPVVHADDKLPSKPIRIVTPMPPGVAPDVFARWYAVELQKSLGVPVLVDNKPGASGNIGTDAVAKAPADGYTLLYGFNQLVTMNPHLFTKLPYDAEKNLQPLSQTLVGGYVLLANNDFKPRNIKELLAYARAQPTKVNYGSYGPGTASHLIFELISDATKVDFVQVPYKQGVVTDVMGGQVPMVFEPAGSALPFVKSGRLRALAVTTPKRLEALPDVPTLAEAIPGLEVTGWQGFLAPAGLPPAVASRLTSEIVRITKTPETVAKIREVGFEPTGTSAAELGTTMRRESAQWGAVIKAKNIRLD